MKIDKVGIDTVQIEIKGLHDVKADNKIILNDKTTYTNKGNTRLVLKGLHGLFNIKEMLECPYELEEI